jgi:hypothetical protein
MSFNVNAKVQFPEYLTGGLDVETGRGRGGANRKHGDIISLLPILFPFSGKM